MARAVLILSASTLWCCALPGTASAQRVAQPPLDLGQTSFLDGEGAPGFLLETIGLGTAAGYATDGAGRAAPGTNRQWSANVTLHPVYTSKASLLGGNPGVELLFPFSLMHLDVPDQPVTTQGGAGDVTISPFIQWSGGALLGKPFASRLAFQGVTPSGSYKASRPVNGGTNVWQVSPYYALTWRPLDRWEVSVRLIYGWSSRNMAPPPALGAGSVQPGSQFAANYAASYAITPRLRLGVSGYVLRQLTDTRVGGRAVAGLQQQTFGLGPGLLWNEGPVRVIANVFREFGARNRPEGVNAVARLLIFF